MNTTGDAVATRYAEFPVLALTVPLLVALGYWVTARMGETVDRPATSARAPHAQLVGRACVVCSARLGRTAGRAEVITPGGLSTEIQVRLAGEAPHAAGWTALIYGYDTTGDCFWVTPIDLTSLPADR